MVAVRGVAGGDDGVELRGGLFAAFEVREYAAAREARAEDDCLVRVGRREEYRLTEVRERLVQTLGLQVLVESLLRREARGLTQRAVHERLRRRPPAAAR